MSAMIEAIPSAVPGAAELPGWYTRVCRRIARGCMVLGVAGLVALIVTVSWQVFGRYVMNDTPTWAESLALLLVLYVTMLGTVVAVRDAGHIGLESLLVLAPDELRLKMEYLIHLLVLLFGVAMAWNCAFLAQSVWGYRLPTLWISEGWKYVPGAFAGVLIVIFSIEHLIALAQGREVEAAWS
jgi:TRAP-type C4-dicarboxylate transport system permease small subunit